MFRCLEGNHRVAGKVQPVREYEINGVTLKPTLGLTGTAGTAITVITVIAIFSGDSPCVFLLENLLEEYSTFKYFHLTYFVILCFEQRQSQYH